MTQLQELVPEIVLLGGDEIELKYLGGTRYEIKGALVLFGDGIQDADPLRDYFAIDTDYDLDADGTGKATVYYNHGLDPVIGKTRIGVGKASLKKDDKAVWLRHELDTANKYDAWIIELIQKRKQISGKSFGFSSGGVKHLVEREAQSDGSYKITRWPLGADASITLIPADWRQALLDIGDLKPVTMKSLTNSFLDNKQTVITFDKDGKPVITYNSHPEINSEAETETETEAQLSEGEQPISADDVNVEANADDSNTHIDNQEIVEVIPMTEQVNPETTQEEQVPPPSDNVNPDMKVLQEQQQQTNEQLTKLMKFMEDEPRIARGGYITVDGGMADQNIKNAPDMLMAIKRADDTRLMKHYGIVKAQTEGTGSAGGYYIPEQVLQDMMPELNLSSMLGSLVTRIPVSQPSGWMPIPNYVAAPTADAGNTAEAQGIESQARSEAGAYVEESIAVERVNYLVSDNTSGYVKASRELREDYPAIEALLRNAIQRDVTSKEEFYILRGNGVGEPLGVLNWVGTIDIAEDTDNTFVFADALELVSRLHAVNENRVAWVHHPSIVTSIGIVEVGTGGAVLATDLTQKIPNRFLGYGRMASQHLPQIGTNGYILIGDWSFYFLFERGGLYIDFSEHADFLNGNDVWRFGKRFDGKPLMTDKVTLADGSFTVSPFVAIQNLS